MFSALVSLALYVIHVDFDETTSTDLMCSICSQSTYTGVLISPQPVLVPDIYCLMVRIFRLMLVLLYV